jgi:hypothetical protein
VFVRGVLQNLPSWSADPFMREWAGFRHEGSIGGVMLQFVLCGCVVTPSDSEIQVAYIPNRWKEVVQPVLEAGAPHVLAFVSASKTC